MPSPARNDLHLDAATLENVRRTMGSQANFEDLLREFLTSSAALIAQIDSRRPSAGIERAAHTLKSMARLLGAEALAEACRKVEFAAHGPRAPPVPAHLVEKVRSEALHAQEAVRRLIV